MLKLVALPRAVLFPVAVLLLGLAAWLWPALFVVGRPAILPLLMLIMFSMGATLQLADFQRVLRRPAPVLLGVSLQYLCMPALGWLLGQLLGLELELLVGMVLVGAVAGGTASNVICFLARGDVALSISMTLFSTLVAVLATPLLTALYVGQSVPVPMAQMLLTMLQLIVLPVAAGLGLRAALGECLQRLEPLLALLAMLAIVLVIAVVLALNHARLADVSGLLLLAVLLHNAGGLALGYGVSRLLGFDVIVARTVAIEVGMQNSGLAVALALKHFSAAAALPGALFSVWHNVSGATLAAWWSRQPFDGPEVSADSQDK